jgi:signal transduction histidine kinase
VERATVVIISDEPEFSAALTRCWLAQRDVPAFILAESNSCARLSSEAFDLAVVGGISAEYLNPVMNALRVCGKPVVHVSDANSAAAPTANFIALTHTQGWPELLVGVGSQILERERAVAELAALRDSNSQLEQHASLGRYMLEVRHSLNNALTSILGNSDLILLNPDELAPALRAQIETIRNMGMRINEIMQRFSSLQKEMQLVNQQNHKRAAGKSAGA